MVWSRTIAIDHLRASDASPVVTILLADQPEDLHIHARRVVDQRRRDGRLGEAGRADQLVAEGEQVGALEWIRRVVDLPAPEPPPPLDVQPVALDQEVLQRAWRRRPEGRARLEPDERAGLLARETAAPKPDPVAVAP